MNGLTTGWTSVLSFSCNQDANLKDNAVSFTVSDGIKISSFWGMPAKITSTQTGSLISLQLTKYWPVGDGYVLPKGTVAKLSFSPSKTSFTISAFKVGSMPAAALGKVTLTSVVTGSSVPIVLKATPAVTVITTSNKIAGQGQLNFVTPVTVSELPGSSEGVSYTLKTEPFEENGFLMTPLTKGPFKVFPNKTTAFTISYSLRRLSLMKVSYKVTGIPSGSSTVVSIKKNVKSSVPTVTNVKADGTYNISIYQDDSSYTVEATGIRGYRLAVSPTSFKANETALVITVTVAKVTISKKVVFGYWENWKKPLPGM